MPGLAFMKSLAKPSMNFVMGPPTATGKKNEISVGACARAPGQPNAAATPAASRNLWKVLRCMLLSPGLLDTSSLGIEMMDRFGRPVEPHRAARREFGLAPGAHRERFAAHRAMQDQVGAEVFDAAHGGRHARAERHGFGPDAEPFARAPLYIAAGDASLLQTQQVHRRCADETRGERGRGLRIEFARRRRLLDAPLGQPD